jgi:glycosyltransferase involved in cell wall biosynthesis
MVTTTVPAPFVSILVPCRNEEGYIAACLESIRHTEYPADRLEILVLDGRSDDRTRAIATDVATTDGRIRVLENPGRTAPCALNLGIREARGSVIVRMDAHGRYPPEYLPRLVAALEESGADNVGGVLTTLPANDTAMARAVAIAMAHPLAVGNSYFRIGTPTRRWVDTVPFGCFRREVFDRVGGFDEELVRNQDDEFNFRLVRRGGRILLEPSARAWYYGRRTLGQLSRMFYQYGYFKPLVARKIGRVMTVRQLVPAAFLLVLGTAAAAALVWPPAAWAAAAVAAPYGALVTAAALAQARSHGWRCAAVLLAAIPVVHGAYGIGFLRGSIDHLLRFRRRARRVAAPSLSR